MLTNRKSLQYFRLLLDLIIIELSFFVAAILAQSFQILMSHTHMFILWAILNFLWYFVSNVINFYDDYSSKYFVYQFTGILKNVAVQILTTVLYVFFVKELLFTRNFIILYTAFLLILISARVQVYGFVIRKIRGKKKNLRNVLIVGAGETGKVFQQMLQEHTDFGYNIIGFIDNTNKGEEILGKVNDIEKIILEKNIEAVVIALSFSESFQLEEIINTCSKNGIRAYIIPDYFSTASKKFQVSMIGDFPVITVRDEPLSEIHWRFVKRTIDLIFSFVMTMLILSWLTPLLFIINKVASGGSTFFSQDRIGTNNTVFRCYKYRTMVMSNNKSEEYQPSFVGDPRITPIGKFLRKTNLDEIPQFVNILKGEMSLVGPRPHALAYDNLYKDFINEIKIRSWVKPGLTGWAQVHGLRGDLTDVEENKKRIAKRIEYDLWYIENWSIWLDIQIILLTIWQMIKGEAKGI